MQIRVLGPVEVLVDGHARPLPGAGERELLALLALAAGRVVPVPALIDALLHGQALSADETTWAMQEIMSGQASDAQIAGFAVALATSPATGGIRYSSGAVRATPRTALIQPHTSQPRNADTSTAHNMPAQMASGTWAQSTCRPAGTDSSTTGALPSSVA